MLKYFLLASLLCLSLSANKANFQSLVIENADRKIDLTLRYPQFTTIMKIKNKGNQNVDSFYLALREDWVQQQYLLQVHETGKSTEFTYKTVEDLEIKNQYNANLIEIKFPTQLKSQSEISLTVIEKYYNIMQFLPKQIKIKEDQLVVFEDNAYILSPYLVEKQKTEFKLSGVPIKATEISHFTTQKGPILSYGTFENIKSFSVEKIRLHFMNNVPYAIFKSINASIEVSHWGNIAIQAFYKLKNEGAQFTGEYSRVDYNQFTQQQVGRNALKQLSAELPYHAWGLYYRDEIGNISTSHAQRRDKDKDVKLDITPRFSLFGGWKSNFEIGYNLPLHHYLFQSSTNPDQYTLSQLFGFPFEGFIAEEYELRVILPEGAKDITTDLPFYVDQSQTVTYSYLDTIGKPTLIFKKNLISDYHLKEFNVSYTLNKYSIFFKPMLLICGFLLLFMSFIIIKRLEFKSLKVKEEVATK